MRAEEKAKQLLAEACDQFGREEISVGGEAMPLPTNDEQTEQVLKQLIGTFDAATQTRLKSWKLFRGGQDRNAESVGGMPLSKREWTVNTAVFVSDEKKISKQYEWFREHNVAAIPVAQPLAVGDYLIMQAARRVLGVEMQTGKRIWPYPWDGTGQTPQDDQPANDHSDAIGSTRRWAAAKHNAHESVGRLCACSDEQRRRIVVLAARHRATAATI